MTSWKELAAEKRLVITLTRVYVGHYALDDDNLRATFKHVRDGIADWLGVDDSPRSGIEWRYEQMRWCATAATIAGFGIIAPSVKAEWWATFETRDLKAERREERTLKPIDAMPGTTCDRLRVEHGATTLLIDNASEQHISIEASIIEGLVRVVLR